MMLRQKSFPKELLFSCAGISANGRLWCHTLPQAEEQAWRMKQVSVSQRKQNDFLCQSLWNISSQINFIGNYQMNSCSIKIILMKEMRQMCYGWIYITRLDAQSSCKKSFFMDKYYICIILIRVWIEPCLYHENKKTVLAKPMSKVNLLYLLQKVSKCCLVHDSKHLICSTRLQTHLAAITPSSSLFSHWCYRSDCTWFRVLFPVLTHATDLVVKPK